MSDFKFKLMVATGAIASALCFAAAMFGCMVVMVNAFVGA